MIRGTSIGIGAAVLLLFGFVPGTLVSEVEAQDEGDERAVLHFRAGTSYYEEENFEQALEEFQAAYRLSERPEMLYNIGVTLERLGRWEEAAEAHAEFLEAVPDGPNSAEARVRLERSRERAEREAPDEEEEGAEASPPAEVETPAEPVVEAEGSSNVIPWTVLGVSGALAVVALGTGLAAHGKHGDLEEDCPDRVCPADRADAIDRGEALARTSTAFTFIAAAGAIAGVVLLLVGGDDDEDESRATLEVAPTRGGGYVQGRLVF